MKNRVSNCLRMKNVKWKRGDEIRALFKLRCDNLEEKNKFWLGKRREIVFSVTQARTTSSIMSKNARRQEVVLKS